MTTVAGPASRRDPRRVAQVHDALAGQSLPHRANDGQPPSPESKTPSGASPRASVARRSRPGCGRRRRASRDHALEHRHAHGHARLDLVEDDARSPSATSRVDLDAAVDGPGCMTMASGLAQREHPGVQAEGPAYSRVLAIIAPASRSFWMRSIMTTSAPSTASSMPLERPHRGPERLGVVGASACAGRRGAPRPRAAPRSSAFERATRECRMSPQMATIRPSMLPLVAADGERVEQRLRRVLVRAVAGVDDAMLWSCAATKSARARRRVPQHDGVGAHRLEVPDRVEQRLALGHARRLRADVHDVGAEALAGDLERRARARRRLEEEVHDRAAPAGRARSSPRRARTQRRSAASSTMPMSPVRELAMPSRWRWFQLGAMGQLAQYESTLSTRTGSSFSRPFRKPSSTTKAYATT